MSQMDRLKIMQDGIVDISLLINTLTEARNRGHKQVYITYDRNIMAIGKSPLEHEVLFEYKESEVL